MKLKALKATANFSFNSLISLLIEGGFNHQIYQYNVTTLPTVIKSTSYSLLTQLIYYQGLITYKPQIEWYYSFG